MNDIFKYYKMKDNGELLEVQIPPSSLFSLYFFFNLKWFFILRTMENHCWTENRRLNSNIQLELQS